VGSHGRYVHVGGGLLSLERNARIVHDDVQPTEHLLDMGADTSDGVGIGDIQGLERDGPTLTREPLDTRAGRGDLDRHAGPGLDRRRGVDNLDRAESWSSAWPTPPSLKRGD
jgi:hypothetical protein